MLKRHKHFDGQSNRKGYFNKTDFFSEYLLQINDVLAEQSIVSVLANETNLVSVLRQMIKCNHQF